MPKQIVIAEQLRIAALLTDERVDELIVAQGRYQIGDVYLGTVENVLPGIDAAFVNIGESEKNGFIHVSDLGPLRLKKSAAGITELLEPRQKVLVQVMKEPTGTKGPRLTGNLALPGRYLVLQPHGQGVNISRKISSEGERNRLRALGVLVKPPATGLLVRTEAEGISDDLLIDDLECLLKQWEAIQQAAELSEPPILLNRDEDFIYRILRDHICPDLVRVILDNPNAIERVSNFLEQDSPNTLVEAHSGSNSLLEHFRINSAIQDALRPRVDLPSGGYVIIEPTEALTVIDVNSGSFTRSANARETVLWTNCEAAIEIARQLKLRNIGGVIIIDFIDMESRRDQLQLLEHFTSAVKDDSARPQIAQLTELGLVELTRKRQGQNIYELFGKSCPHCHGLGLTSVLPGDELAKPIVQEAGLVKSTSSIKFDLQNSLESNNIRRKRGGRSRSPNELSTLESSLEATGSSNENQEENSSSEVNNNRQEPDIIPVEMNEQEEIVFSALGLSPALLLDPTPDSENLVVRVIRPGESTEQILEEARQDLSTISNRKRRRGRNSGRGTNRSIPEASTAANADSIEKERLEQAEENKHALSVEITPLEDKDTSEEASTQSPSPENQSAPEPEDPRRRRRRSSAAN
ncbi:Rne/Rng family ribonuclease [Prochlorococcus sp. MIT 1300]|uniref:Rne/Rng family ribonuclease n=1 Tax=Prochlorococcus sp. MIT 1300 TaxID=3096218 RepID=UPI002A75E554|nr:Rne/Rng family ribonuclease [Prochlorococcus sp. MIT 1300]